MDKKEIVKMMEELGLRETKSMIEVGKKDIAAIWMQKEIWQSCPLSPMIFKIVFAEMMEKKFSRC